MNEPLRNRIVGFERVPASSLVPHPQNWRTHPERQREALSALLDAIGFAGAVVARALPDGRLELLDGHLRSETAGDEVVPVVLVDLDDEEARKFLLTADPISGLAESDDALLRELLAGMPALDPSLLAGLQKSYGVDATPPAEPSSPRPPGDRSQGVHRQGGAAVPLRLPARDVHGLDLGARREVRHEDDHRNRHGGRPRC